MNRHHEQPTRLQVFIQILATSFVTMLGLILVACGTTPEASVPKIATPLESAMANPIASSRATGQLTPQAMSTVPSVATMLRTLIPGTQAPTRVYIVETPEYEPTPGLGDPNRESAFDTRVAQNQSARWTALDLTPSSTPASPTATYTPAPTATEFISWLSCGSARNTYVTQYDSCWQLVMNGHIYRVTSGREGRGSDMSQGLIAVSELGPDDRFHDIGTLGLSLRQG
jgi:hypothetical protein